MSRRPQPQQRVVGDGTATPLAIVSFDAQSVKPVHEADETTDFDQELAEVRRRVDRSRGDGSTHGFAGVVNAAPFLVSRIASSFAGSVLLAFRDTACSCSGVSMNICPAR